MTIAIEKEIEMPATERKLTPRKSKYPFAEMELNDSFFLPDRVAKSFTPTVYAAGKRLGRKFAVRSVDGGVRVWRVL